EGRRGLRGPARRAHPGHGRQARPVSLPSEGMTMRKPDTLADEVVVLRDVMVPMRDGIRLATDITLPAKGGRALPGPFPTLLHRTPYGKRAVRLSEISVR